MTNDQANAIRHLNSSGKATISFKNAKKKKKNPEKITWTFINRIVMRHSLLYMTIGY